FHERVQSAAVGLQRLGVQQGQHVVVWLPNGPNALTLWFAINYIGAVYVPLNIAWRGGLLESALRIAEGVLIVAHDKLIDRFAELEDVVPKWRVSVGGSTIPGWLGEATLFKAEGKPEPLQRDILPWDTQSIVYTSGTT